MITASEMAMVPRVDTKESAFARMMTLSHSVVPREAAGIQCDLIQSFEMEQARELPQKFELMQSKLQQEKAAEIQQMQAKLEAEKAAHLEMLAREKEEVRKTIEAQHANKMEELQQQWNKQRDQWMKESQIMRQELEMEKK
jgi:hypothetical protein